MSQSRKTPFPLRDLIKVRTEDDLMAVGRYSRASYRRPCGSIPSSVPTSVLTELRNMQRSDGKAIDASVTYRIRAAALRTE